MATTSACRPFRSPEARERYLAYYDGLEAACPIAWERNLIDTDAGTTLVRITGDPVGRPLVMLPGMWAHSLQWGPAIIEPLASVHRVYAVDNIHDFGRSVLSRPVRSTADVTAWLDGLFDELGLAPGFAMLGYSHGGWIAAEYALHAPERLGALVLLAPGGVVQTGLTLGAILHMHLTARAILRPSDASLGAMMSWLMPDMSSDPSFDDWVRGCAIAHQCFERKAIPRGTSRVFSDDDLRALDMPLMLIDGEESRLCNATAEVARLQRVRPDARTVLFPGCGHGVGVVREAEVARHTLEFLAPADEKSEAE